MRKAAIRPILFFILLQTTVNCFSQESNNWLFGYNGGISFHTSPPNVISGSSSNTVEATASISDTAGQLLFYTDGIFVYNKNHQLMANGTGLLGGASATHCLIVRKPGSHHLYYIFTADDNLDNLFHGFRYSVVDMTLNNGLGEVIEKNTLLDPGGTEKIATTLHANGKDFWIITKGDEDIFNVYRLDCNGITTDLITSRAGFVYDTPGYLADAQGIMKVSPDGKRIATALFIRNGWNLLEFDNSTGKVSNGKYIQLSSFNSYGVEFSPDSKLVYISGRYDNLSGGIFQYKTEPFDALAIQNSVFRIDSSVLQKMGIQLGADGKIYSLNLDDTKLNVIHNPNVYGPGSNFIRRELDIAPGYMKFGLPTFDQSQISNPHIEIQHTVTGNCGSVDFSATSSYAGPVTYTWNFGDGTYATGQQVSHVFGNSGNLFDVIVTVSSPGPCGIFASKMKRIQFSRIPPIAKFGFRTSCGNLSVSFSDSTKVPGGSILSWKWDFGDGNFSTVQNPVHQYQTFGEYQVRLLVKSNDGCQTEDEYVETVVIGPKPVSNFSVDNGCVREMVQFTDLSTIEANSIQQWYWSFGDGQSSNVQNPTHDFATPGIYSAYLVTISNGGCISDTFRMQLPVTAKPVVDFAFDNGCIETNILFTDNSTISGAIISKWYWDFGNGSTSLNQNPTASYNFASSYTVRLAVSSESNCKSDTVEKIIVIEEPPITKMGSISECGNLSVAFKDSSVATTGIVSSWYWDFGDGITSASQHPDHTYSDYGTYSVKFVSKSNLGCASDTLVSTILVPAKPLANFTLPDVCLLDAQAVFENTSTIADNSNLSYLWKFGDHNAVPLGSDVSSDVNGIHSFSEANYYDINLIATSETGCADTLIQIFTVNGAVPNSSFRVLNENSFCSNENVFIKDSSTVDFGNITRLKIYWGDGDSTIDDSPMPAIVGGIYDHLYPSFSSPSTKTFTITQYAYSGSLCVAVTTRQIILKASPQIQFNTLPDVCNFSAPLLLTQASEIWNTPGTGGYSGAGVNTATNTFDPTIAGVGTHPIVFTFVSNEGCRADSVRSIVVNANPVASFAFTSECLPEASIHFTNTSTLTGSSLSDLTHTWTFGDPNANAGNPNSSNAISPSHTYSSFENFQITLDVFSASGCGGSISQTLQAGLNIFKQPQANFSLDSTRVFCKGTSTRFVFEGESENGPIVKWWWDLAGTKDSTNLNPEHLFLSPGFHNAGLVVLDNKGCKSEPLEKPIYIESIPIANFEFDTSCVGKPIHFSDLSTNQVGDITKWQWSFGDGNISHLQEPVHTYNHFDSYVVNLVVETENGCKSAVSSKSVAIERIEIFAGRDTVVAKSEPLQLQAFGAENYTWTPSTGLNDPFVSNPVATLQNEQTYFVRGITSGGCLGYDTIKVVVFANADIYVPTGFSPNNDGLNDTFKPVYVGIKELRSFRVFNRWGQLVFSSTSMNNGWDGRFNGRPQDASVFVWVVNGVTYDNRVVERKGNVTLVR